MEVEEPFSSCFPDFITEAAMEHEPSSEKPLSAAAGDDAADACFDCNICLNFAADPVITLCGHLYCWPCIYRWLHLDSVGAAADDDGWSHCPVCKSHISESSLIPLYGRGLSARSHNQSHGIPDRPKDHRKLVAPASTVAVDHRQQIYPFYSDGQESSIRIPHSIAGAVLGEMVLPRATRNHQEFFRSLILSPELLAGGIRGGRRRRRMQELRIESWLHQLWVFLFCCAVLCLVFF